MCVLISAAEEFDQLTALAFRHATLEAAKWLADRGFGRSVQPVDVDLGLRAPVFDAARLSDRELETVIALLQKAQPDDG